jgi:hypothetical protein
MKKKRNGPGDYTVKTKTTLDGRKVEAEFKIMKDEEADKIQGRCLWPISGIVDGVEIKTTLGRKRYFIVLDAGSWLRESMDILENMCEDGFVTVNGIPEPKVGLGCYS